VSLDSVLFTVPEQLRPAMKVLIKHITTEIYNVQITEDEKLYLPQNYIDIAEELYDILDKKGEPMHVEDIFKEFKTRYPDHKFTDPLQIKSYLFKHKHIKAVGKTSCYALDSWEGVYFGSIRDLLVDLLSDSDVPLHIDNLYDGVTEHYPNTTKASVAATMEDENFQRFIEFEGSYFGLTSKEYSADFVPASSVQRYSFEDRFQMFKDFIETYRRFPSYNGGDKEASLMRWYYNVTTGVLSMTDEQRTMLNDALRRYDELGIPRYATESEFLLKCQDVKDYIRQHHTLPTNKEAPELYAWLRRSRDNYDSFTDKRRQYLTDLLNYVLSFGFSI
jgi:Fe2+ or Zn2+ uptake regulation protein